MSNDGLGSNPQAGGFSLSAIAVAVDGVGGGGSSGGDYISFSAPATQGATINLTPVIGGFGGFDGVVVQYAKGDEASNGVAIQGVSASLGAEATLTTFIVGIGADTAGQHLTFSTSDPRPGRVSSLLRTSNDSGTERAGGFGYSDGSRADAELYFSYHKKFDSDSFSISTANYKEYYIFSNGTDGNSITEKPQPIFVGGAGNSSMKAGNNVGVAGNINNTAGWTIPGEIDHWGRREIHLKLNTPGLADGLYNVWIDRVKGISDEAYEMQPNDMIIDATGFKGVRLGYFDSNMNNSIIPHSDYYVATSPARVEIGNASTWAACTKTELQPVVETDFLTAQITGVTLDKGAFSTLAGNYLYVIKSDGTPFNESGELL